MEKELNVRFSYVKTINNLADLASRPEVNQVIEIPEVETVLSFLSNNVTSNETASTYQPIAQRTRSHAAQLLNNIS